MKQQLSVVLAAALLAASPTLASDPAPAASNPFNCDFEPACEVAPGVYGNLNAPASSKFNLAIGSSDIPHPPLFCSIFDVLGQFGSDYWSKRRLY